MLPPATVKPAAASGYENNLPKSDLTPWRYMEFKPLEERRAGWIGRVISQETLSGLEKQCNIESVTLNSALTAALLLAASGEGKPEQHLCLTSPLNLRQYCRPQLSDEHFGCYIMMLEGVYTVKPDGTFWELARHCQVVFLQRLISLVKQQFKTIPKKFHKAFLISAMAANLARGDKKQQFQGGPVLSYVGPLIFHEDYGPLRLTEWYGGIPHVAGLHQLFLVAGIMHEKLFCGFSYTDPLLSAKAAENIADRFASLLDTASSKK
jgi:hypothetical protein